MADKMMRIAGRGTDGTAKAFKTDNEGNIGAQVVIPGKNIFNKDNAILEKYVALDGLTRDGANWYMSDYTQVEPNRKIVFNILNETSAAGTAFYDESKQFIGSVSNTAIMDNNNTLDVPAGTKFIRSTCNTTIIEPNDWQIEYGNISTRKGQSGTITPNSEQQIGDLPDDSFFDGYELVADAEKYQLFEYPASRKQPILCAYNHILVRGRSSIMYLKDTQKNTHYTIKKSNFPGMLGSDEFESVFILPWTRNLTTSQKGAQWRMVVITKFGRIYHNFPSRAVGSDGEEVPGDIVLFDESVVWDAEGRKYPSASAGATGTETYFPGLPSALYDYYPKLNTDPTFTDTYGNGGFGKSITHGSRTLARFYEPRRDVWQCHSFGTMGGFSATEKITLIGTYRSNVGKDASRICMFATSDGGRSWYNIYEFAGSHIDLTSGRNINTADIVSAYTANSYVMQKRTLIIPTALEKEPTEPFELGSGVVVSGITKASPAVVTTAAAHGLTTGNIVVFKDNSESANTSPDWDWMLNPGASATSGGNGRMFVAEVINSTSFKIYEYPHSTENNLPCRHIHCINRIKDGWMIGTGETYPNGWIMYMQMKTSETFQVIRAYDTASWSFYRLNSSADGLQRPLGVMMKDDADSTIFIASDHGFISRSNAVLPEGRTITFSRSSFGVFKGKLSDADDFSKFDCIFEAEQPAYYFKEHRGAWVFCGQRGEVGISFDKGLTWYREQLLRREAIQHQYGMYGNVLVVNSMALLIK